MAFGDAIERMRVALEEHDCRPRGGAKLRARCPVHESHGPTLAVSQGRAGAVMYCHAQCDTRDILDAIGLAMDDLFDEPRERDAPRFIRKAVTPATDAEMAGRVIIRALRVAMGRSLDVWRDRPGPGVSWQERVRRAEDGCRQDAEAHYWQFMARCSALATDEVYVGRAYRQRKVNPFRMLPEQCKVLRMRAEDLARERPASDGMVA